MDLVFSSLIVFFFLVKRAPLKIYSIWEPFFKMKRNEQKVSFFRKIFIAIYKIFHSLLVLLQDFDILYYTVYILAGIVGLTIHPFFFAFHLMDFMKLEQLKTVVKAIWEPKIEIMLALLLLVIVNYYFSILAYIIFYGNYEDLYTEEPPKCSEFWRCMFV